MSEIAAIQKQLKIKSGTVQRYKKEATLYRKEVEDLGKKLDNFVAENTEEWYIKNTKRMIEESEKMIADTGKKLDKAIGDLKDLLRQVEGISDMADTEEFKGALKLTEA